MALWSAAAADDDDEDNNLAGTSPCCGMGMGLRS